MPLSEFAAMIQFIKKYRLSGNGLDNYYWVPFVVLDSSLKNNYNINFGSKINHFINVLKNTKDIKYYPEILERAKAYGFNPHLSIPRLDLLTNKDQELLSTLDLSLSDVNNLGKPLFANYINSDNNNNNLQVVEFTDN